MRTTAIVAALLLATASMASAQGGPDGRMGGPAGGGMEGPGGPGGGAPSGRPEGGGGRSDGGGPALRGPEGPGTGGSDAGGPGLGDAPRAAREARPEREARQPEAKSDRGERAERPDRGARKAAEDAGDGAREARKSTEDAGSAATSKSRKAAEDATEKGEADQARAKDSAHRKDATDQKATEEAKDAQGKAADKETPRAGTAGSAKPERAKQVELSGEKRDRVQTALRDKPDVKHRTDVHIDISVGRRLPRDWDFAPLPVAVIEIVPEYRDYVYVWVEEEYLICDPVTYEVVAVIPAREHGYAASRSGGPSGKCSTRIELSADERELILDTVRSGREVDVSNLEIGWSVPSEIALERFPEPVLAEAAELSACRYFVADDQLAIVDPDEDKVVLLIDKS
jgi:hypothetical protein